MFILGETIVTEELFSEYFICDLPRCKGECCVSGDAGAPLEEEEISIIEDYLEFIKPYMSEGGIKAVEEQGVFDYDSEGMYVTSLIEGRECAFAGFDEKGISYCAIEKAYLDGKIDFKKPISCHLYPIRLEKMAGFTHLHYHRWSVCLPAIRKGRKEGVPLYVFLKEPLIRRFGKEWYGHIQDIAKMKKEDRT